jgi:hypothetical protein
MDYTQLQISDRQIRLITILPLLPDEDANAIVRCTMTVRDQLLPDGDSHADGVSPDDVDFDPCVTDPPQETLVQELRNGIDPILWALETQAHLEKMLGESHPPSEPYYLYFQTYDIPNLLSPEDRSRVLSEVGRGGEWRLRGDWGEVHAFEDEAGYGLALLDGSPPPHTGTIAVDKVNPFFRRPNRDRDGYRDYLAGLDAESYVAMSYAWGPPGVVAEIMVNGAKVQVRPNLEAALRQFRTMDYFALGGKVWIDPLCINQQDELEKEKQVQMMASIYRCAGNVIVWLGPEEPGSDLAISFLESISADYRAEYLEFLDSSNPLTATTWRSMAQIRMETNYEELRISLLEDAWDGLLAGDLTLQDIPVLLYDFFDRPYWRRLWIIQELCMARPGTPIV